MRLLRPFGLLFGLAIKQLWTQSCETSCGTSPNHLPLEEFGYDVLTLREAEIIQMVLKGHSGVSISVTLGIAVPTVKTHRKNAYAKLGINTQQQLFNAFIEWQNGNNRKS